jgi:argininosuccinate lyase
VAGEKLTLTPDQVRNAMSAENFVRSRRGIGGPQAAEMTRMLTGHRGRVQALRKWVDAERARIRAAEEKLNSEFVALVAE